MNEEIERIYKEYKKQGFTIDQLVEIKLGLEENLEVELYARPAIPSEEMSYIRKTLKSKSEDETDPLDISFDSYEVSVQKRVYKKVVGFAIWTSIIAIVSGVIEILIFLYKR